MCVNVPEKTPFSSWEDELPVHIGIIIMPNNICIKIYSVYIDSEVFMKQRPKEKREGEKTDFHPGRIYDWNTSAQITESQIPDKILSLHTQ